MLRAYIDKIVINDKDLYGPNSRAFVNSLNHLDSMVGLQQIKDKVVKHVNHAIAEMRRGVTADNFHNVLITGEQGRGKTELAKAIGNIFVTLGYFSVKKPQKSKLEVTIDALQLNRVFKYILNKSRETRITDSNRASILRKRNRRNLRYLSRAYRTIILSKLIPYISSTDSEEAVESIIKEQYDLKGCPPDIDNEMIISYMFDEDSEEPKEPPVIGKCKVFGKSDVVASYVGQTSKLTKAALEECKGGVFILDEAYSLLNTTGKGGSPCTFGLESLNTINQYLSEHPIDQMVIFLGYKDMILSLYDNQRGLYRRFNWIYDIDEYTPRELSEIYHNSIPKNIPVNFSIEEVEKIIESNKGLFFNGAGDCINLRQYSIVEMDWDHKTELGIEHFSKGLDILKDKIEGKKEKSGHLSMYL